MFLACHQPVGYCLIWRNLEVRNLQYEIIFVYFQAAGSALLAVSALYVEKNKNNEYILRNISNIQKFITYRIAFLLPATKIVFFLNSRFWFWKKNLINSQEIKAHSVKCPSGLPLTLLMYVIRIEKKIHSMYV